jgi:hypothetical protein
LNNDEAQQGFILIHDEMSERHSFFTNEIPQNGTLHPLGRKMRRFASRIDFVASTQLFFV